MTRRRREAFYSLAVLAVFLFGAEMIARRAWDPPGVPRGDDLFRYAADRELLYEYRPGWQGERVLGGCKGAHRINGQGLPADHDYATSKPPGVVRIASLGDSVAFLSPGKNYATLLQERFDASPVSGRRVEVLDFSVVGYNSLQERIVLRDKVPGFEPDFVVLGYCWNDDYPAAAFVSAARHPASLGGITHSRLATFLEQRWDGYRARRAVKKPWSRERAAVAGLFDDLAAAKRERGVGVVVLVFPVLVGELNAPPRIGTAIAAARRDGLDVLEPRDLFGDAPAERLAISPDDQIHMSELAHRLVAERVFEWVTRRARAPREEPSPARPAK